MIWRGTDQSERGLKTWIKARKPDVVIADIPHWQTHLPEPYASQRFVSLSILNETSPLTGIYQNTELLAEQAVDLLMHVRLRKQTGIPERPSTNVCDGTWHPGSSFQPKR